MNEPTLRNTIKVQRAKANLTQDQLSALTGVTRTTINYVERGKWVPSTILALKIVKVFGVPFEEVFFLSSGDATAGVSEGA